MCCVSATGPGGAFAGEPDFEDFYAAVFDQLVGQLFLVSGNLQDAEDAVQEALTRAAVRWKADLHALPRGSSPRLRP
jgi:RNA polymerase sigma-70 factor (ECF subfamily)